VIRLAQLDIGFVRSRTEIAVLEMQGGYPRAHLTRYTAFYSSLSSNYTLRFADASAISRPFPPTASPDRPWPVTCRRDRDVELSGFKVASNSTGFVHSEQMFEPGGAIRLVGEFPAACQVVNESDLDLHEVGVLRRGAGGAIWTCWIGDLPAQRSVPLAWRAEPSESPRAWLAEWDARAAAVDSGGPAAADLTGLTQLAALGVRLGEGDVRLIGRVDGVLPGLTVSPASSQVDARALVLVHLRRGALPAPVRDRNVVEDVEPFGAGQEPETPPAGEAGRQRP
jgi:hypothetical protein